MKVFKKFVRSLRVLKQECINVYPDLSEKSSVERFEAIPDEIVFLYYLNQDLNIFASPCVA